MATPSSFSLPDHARLVGQVLLDHRPEWRTRLTVEPESAEREAGLRLELPDPVAGRPSVVLTTDEFDECTLQYGDWHTHSAYLTGVAREAVAASIAGLLDTIEDITQGRRVAVTAHREGRWAWSALMAPEDVAPLDPSDVLTVVAWGQGRA